MIAIKANNNKWYATMNHNNVSATGELRETAKPVTTSMVKQYIPG